jgi:hypothetical protein
MKAGTLDADTGLEYKVFASYGDPRLPAEYRGNDAAAGDSQIDAELAQRFSSLPAAMQQAVGPYLIPAYYEGSWHDLRTSGKKVADGHDAELGASDNSVPCGIELRMLATWTRVTTANQKVSVWYQTKVTGDAAIAQNIATELDRAWPLLVAAMKGREPLGDGGPGRCRGTGPEIDLTISDIPGSHVKPYLFDVLGGSPSRPLPVFIEISRAGDLARDPVASAVHEVMHAFQYAFTAKGALGHTDADPLWMMEATSQWAQHLDRPAGNEGKEQVAASINGSLLKNPKLSLDEPNQRHGYSAYLLPLFMQLKYGDTEFVGRAFAAREQRSTFAEAIEDALSSRGGFAEVWPEFIQWNLNRAPVNEYTTRDSLTATADYATDGDVPARASFMHEESVSLPRLSAMYQHFSFKHDEIRTVTMYNGFSQTLSEQPVGGVRLIGLTLADATVYTGDSGKAPPEGASVYVITKVAGKDWDKPLDITDRSYITFCRDALAERLEEMIVVYGNSNYKPGAPNIQQKGLTPRLVTNNIGCWGWEGTANWSQRPGGSNSEDLFGTSIRWEREYWPTLGLLTSRPHTTFKLVSGTGAWTSVSDGKSCAGTLDLKNGFLLSPFLEIVNHSIGGGQHHRLAYGWGVANAGSQCRGGPVPWLALGDPSVNMLFKVSPDGSITGTLPNAPDTWIWSFKPIRQ